MSSEGRAVKRAKSAVEENLDNTADKTAVLKDKVSNNISNIADKLHQGAVSGKTFLNDRTDKVNALAHQALEKASEIGHRAADAVGNSSEYIKNFDLEETKESVKAAVKEKPEYLLLAVGVLGLAVGYLLGRKKV